MNDPATAYRYGTYNDRMFAWTIDLFILILVGYPFRQWLVGPAPAIPVPDLNTLHTVKDYAQAIWNALRHSTDINQVLVKNTLQFLLLAAYVLPCWWRWGATPGKMLLRLQIRDAENGEKLSHRQVFIRFFSYLLAGLPLFLGFVYILFNKKRRGLHDIIAGTVVVVKPRTPRPM